jgi:hypothetical protein
MLAVVTLMVGFSAIHAQSDIYKWEGFGGYAYMNLNRGIDPDEVNDEFSDFPTNRVNAHGFNGSFTYNFTRYIGAKFDVTLHSHGEDFTSGLQISAPPAPPIPAATLKTSQNVYQYMGGIQIKDNKKDSQKFKPWAHVLGGIAHQNFTIDETAPVAQRLIKVSSDDFAMKFGGARSMVTVAVPAASSATAPTTIAVLSFVHAISFNVVSMRVTVEVATVAPLTAAPVTAVASPTGAA